ncbi:NAD(P)/FAD-dependent oxidoreductase [Natranaerobius trueperi]|uniref:NAD(P)/FAD-dependent oxidoreductase n=1 Tax=Natranaerobius trueperi TaxID=759412 RepID=UPI001303A823|nr:NAD(P)/FAD-dependent oxidoreductase [Natranaerobius trueperi]
MIAEQKEEGENDVKLLSELCEKVYYIPLYKEEINVPNNVEVLYEKPNAIIGENKVQQLQLENTVINCDGIFILREAIPTSQLVQSIEYEGNAIKVSRDMSTNIPGIFAAGDITGWPYQISKAVCEGQIAALSAMNYIKNLYSDAS